VLANTAEVVLVHANMITLVQLKHPSQGRRVALVETNELRLLAGFDSVYRLAEAAAAEGRSLAQLIGAAAAAADRLPYDPVYRGQSDWRLLPAFDHPAEPARCLVTGTGLTHKASAENRQAMHKKEAAPISDSLRMYQAGLAGGRPAPGQIGAQPEWFYKGTGAILRAHGEPLEVPSFGLDGGEEAEVAGAYFIDDAGMPRRVGLVLGNEFSDHKLEAQNYLYLAHSKLRTCAIGPELIVNAEFPDARGVVRVERGGSTLWSMAFVTGEANMCHSLANLEHHYFNYAAHRRPGDAHIHFFGADVFSFGEGIELADGDVMEIELAGFGRPLRNPLRIDHTQSRQVCVEAL
jgi:hypothetical protein